MSRVVITWHMVWHVMPHKHVTRSHVADMWRGKFEGHSNFDQDHTYCGLHVFNEVFNEVLILIVKINYKYKMKIRFSSILIFIIQSRATYTREFLENVFGKRFIDDLPFVCNW